MQWRCKNGLDAGFGAAKHLSQQGYNVTLIDASPNPGGLSAGWRTPQGRAVEAGIKGFWYQYHNIFALLRELGIPWPLTDWTTSGFWSPQGLTTEAPVFSRRPQLPTMLGQFVHTLPLFKRLSLADRATMVPLLAAVVDFDATPETYARYDSMTALELFQKFGVSKALYEEFLRPLLLVGLFAPAEELSAAAVLGTFYFYTLAHQNDFDVCWAKGSVSELIFDPLVRRIEAAGGNIVGGRLVSGLQLDELTGDVSAVLSRDRAGDETVHPADGVVFAIGISGMQKLVAGCPELGRRAEFARIANLRSIDCIATRIWFDRRIATQFPANVLSGFEECTGGTWFNLNDLQDEYKGASGAVIAADFYHSNALMPLSDEAIVARIIDSAVLRFPKAVTHFSPGSYASRPLQTTSFGNVFMAGDWVKGVPHGANGLSQERAYVTGLRAANMVVDKLGWGVHADILPVEPDEPYIAALKGANRGVKSVLSASGIRSPFL
ncbi:FAD/NAD(P)-binding domain-containing protein [Coccomyxa subellipsoidea C-169]|uniref:FAD/NAD(P)-binding domain-containing protein n=1 Tax=Coccomyxa subellipsoidea (strain C-169) TaxID=574566 RepID=I0Z4X3_COCSC|nr:FAD/NAD(P)-binding domain-containing protein [Coccomyxa subellipsoidea C-169]EIE25692.1 FAD/NAD(P)-binding domain-containing protein [Coccomyxa subellipsoidea C-169]|eukprot:XP_005650236.1 FAD/NAD(P)-binding domain-containing protein [Coccomyxa subellipsoidea C-169]